MKKCRFCGTSILKAFWMDFGRVLGGQNPRFSHFFRCFFDIIFQARFGRRKIDQKCEKTKLFRFLASGLRWSPGSWGEITERGNAKFSRKCWDGPAVIGQSQLEINLARRWHTFGGRRIELPPGGATAASLFVCKNVGGLPCLEGVHLQDCIAEGSWGNENPHFGYNLFSCCWQARWKTVMNLRRNQLIRTCW